MFILACTFIDRNTQYLFWTKLQKKIRIPIKMKSNYFDYLCCEEIISWTIFSPAMGLLFASFLQPVKGCQLNVTIGFKFEIVFDMWLRLLWFAFAVESQLCCLFVGKRLLWLVTFNKRSPTQVVQKPAFWGAVEIPEQIILVQNFTADYLTTGVGDRLLKAALKICEQMGMMHLFYLYKKLGVVTL